MVTRDQIEEMRRVIGTDEDPRFAETWTAEEGQQWQREFCDLLLRALRSLAIIDGLSEEQREHLRKCPSLMDMPCNRFANPDAFHCIEAHRAVVALMEDR